MKIKAIGKVQSFGKVSLFTGKDILKKVLSRESCMYFIKRYCFFFRIPSISWEIVIRGYLKMKTSPEIELAFNINCTHISELFTWNPNSVLGWYGILRFFLFVLLSRDRRLPNAVKLKPQSRTRVEGFRFFWKPHNAHRLVPVDTREGDQADPHWEKSAS